MKMLGYKLVKKGKLDRLEIIEAHHVRTIENMGVAYKDSLYRARLSIFEEEEERHSLSRAITDAYIEKIEQENSDLIHKLAVLELRFKNEKYRKKQ